MDGYIEKRVSMGRRDPILQGESGSMPMGAAEVCERQFLWPIDLPLLDTNGDKLHMHPVRKHLWLTEVRYDLAENKEWYNVTYTYKGADLSVPDPEPDPDPGNPGGPGGDGGDGGDGGEGVGGSSITYNVEVLARENPIATHPKFEKFGTVENGAQFDAYGKFVGFSMGEKYTSAVLGGVETYIDGGMEFTRTCLVGKSASVMFKAVGKISNPGAGAPNIQGRNWLYMGGSVKTSGSVKEVSEKWLLSGPAGWNKKIYEAS